MKIICFYLFIALGLSSAVAAANDVVRPSIGWEGTTQSDSLLNARLIGRLQNYNANPSSNFDVYDRDIYSPKSVAFHPNNHKVYVNSLEGFSTLVYSWSEGMEFPEKLKVIRHRFNANNAYLFQGLKTVFNYKYYAQSNDGHPNHFNGKPVEMAFSHNGKYLWITYYRRSFDGSGQSPSAVAIIDTDNDEIVRVMPTGPIPKVVAVSEEQGLVAITHWGDNTVGLIDISSDEPNDFYYTKHLMKDKPLSQKDLKGKNRDRYCGLCLRGTVFLPDSHIMLVGAMHGGNILGFNSNSGEYLGSFSGIPSTVRHMVIAEKTDEIIITSNSLGYISKLSINKVVNFFSTGSKGKHGTLKPDATLSVGRGARTVTINKDETLAYSAINNSSQIAVIDLVNFEVLSKILVNSYPVGLDVSNTGKFIWSTSQGKFKKGGGNSINIFELFEDAGTDNNKPLR